MKYSPTTKTYYIPGFPYENLPDDLLDVTYEEWQNGIGKPIDDIPPVPPSVTMYQARAALIMAGLDDDVQNAIDAISDPVQRKLTQNAWDKAATVQRDSPFTQTLAAALGLSDTQLDALFISASKVQ